jgi:hypothetical protein
MKREKGKGDSQEKKKWKKEKGTVKKKRNNLC